MSDKSDYHGDKADKADKFLLRFPTGMRDQLKSDAATNGRSLNAEILFRLERFNGKGTGATGGSAFPATANAPGKIDVDHMDILFTLVSDINASRAVKLTAPRLMHLAVIGYNEMISLVSDMNDEKEVQAFLPAVRYRLERAVNGSS